MYTIFSCNFVFDLPFAHVRPDNRIKAVLYMLLEHATYLSFYQGLSILGNTSHAGISVVRVWKQGGHLCMGVHCIPISTRKAVAANIRLTIRYRQTSCQVCRSFIGTNGFCFILFYVALHSFTALLCLELCEFFFGVWVILLCARDFVGFGEVLAILQQFTIFGAIYVFGESFLAGCTNKSTYWFINYSFC